MDFRNFSIKIKKNHDKTDTTEETAYPAIAVETTKPNGSTNAITDPANTYVLIANDSFQLRWIPATDCEQVDFT